MSRNSAARWLAYDRSERPVVKPEDLVRDQATKVNRFLNAKKIIRPEEPKPVAVRTLLYKVMRKGPGRPRLFNDANAAYDFLFTLPAGKVVVSSQ